MNRTALPVTHYELNTLRGIVRVLPEHRQNSASNFRAGIIYVCDLATGDSFPVKSADLTARCTPIPA